MSTEFTIERLGHQGDGIAEGPFYAPRILPGELISATSNGEQLSDIRILTPSDDRVQPPCRHYKSCGGCQLQHASDDFVTRWKQEIAQSALKAHGLETEWKPVSVSPPQSRRRATLAVRRTKKGALAGFHGRASGVITEIPECQLLDPALLAGVPVAQALAIAGGSRKGELSVLLTLSVSGLDVSVSGGKPLDGNLRIALGHLAESQNLARLTWDGELIALRAAPLQQFGPAEVLPPSGAFLQATRSGETALLGAVQEIVSDAARIADLFAGCGTFALPLAQNAEIYAVEGDKAMMAALDHGWRQAQGLKRVTTETRDLFRRPLLPDELKGFDAVVIDPPRAGAEAQIAELAKASVPIIAHVSCNPVSFARDAKTLCDAGYRLDWAQVVDQFRWSVHTELVAAFTRIR